MALRVHMLSGNDEYSAEASLGKLAEHLNGRHGIACTLSAGRDCGNGLPGLEQLAEADVMLVFCKRAVLPLDQLAIVQRWCEQGRPVVGIRTASHAFQNWLAFDRLVLGGDYNGHGPDSTVLVQLEPSARQHPLLDGLESWTKRDKVYRNPNLADGVTCLARAGVAGPLECPDTGQALAWCYDYPAPGRPGRSFYTSMGHPADFDDTRYLRMITNAVRWTAEKL